jgi:hypothetical protein
MTVPMVQGKTLGRFLLDLNVNDAPGHKMTCLYVMISRATRINNIRLLQPFHHAQLHRCRDTAIRNEELRLLQIESSTLQQFIKAHPECATDVFAIHQPPKEQQTQTKKRSTLSEDSGASLARVHCGCGVCLNLHVALVLQIRRVPANDSVTHCRLYRLTQTQQGSTQCGDFCVAWLVAFAFGDDLDTISQSAFDQPRMRTHLRQSLALGRFTRFPAAPSRDSVQFSNESVVVLNR